MKRSAEWLAGILLLLLAVTADARVIFDNGVAPVGSAFASDPSLQIFAADDFLLQPGSNIITDIHWTGIYTSGNSPPMADDFTIEIFADDGGAPDGNDPLSVINIGNADRVDTGTEVGPYDLFSYSVFVAPLELTPNTSFWLSIINDTTADQSKWAWGGKSQGGNGYSRSPGFLVWTSTEFDQDFQLTSVPEPTSLALLGFGLAGLSLVRKRR